MEITIQRDGLTLVGDLMRPESADRCPMVIIFHGLMSDRGNPRRNLFSDIAEAFNARGMAAVKFDFDGHGESGGEFSDMTVFGEILDAAKIIEYVRGLDWVSDIYIVGHSQGAVVGGMTAGYFRDVVSKLVMLAPAAILKDDANAGTCFGRKYDTCNVPDYVELVDIHRQKRRMGGLYFRTARTLPIYEATKEYKGKFLIIHGSDDTAADIIGAKRYVECMDNAKLEIIESENHGLNKFSHDYVVERVADFLAEN